MKRVVVSSILVLVFGCSITRATITLSGLSFDDNAFADQVVEINGTWVNNVAAAVLGPNITNNTVNLPYDESAYIKVAFTDNTVVNATGADLVVFESTGSDPGCPARITVEGLTHTYATPWRGGVVNAAIIDLDDFGVAPGGSVSTFMLWAAPTTRTTWA